MAKSSGTVSFVIDRCKGCGLCVAVCPEHLIAIDDQSINSKGYHPARITDMDLCIGCANCAVMCPDYVLTVRRTKRQGEEP